MVDSSFGLKTLIHYRKTSSIVLTLLKKENFIIHLFLTKNNTNTLYLSQLLGVSFLILGEGFRKDITGTLFGFLKMSHYCHKEISTSGGTHKCNTWHIYISYFLTDLPHIYACLIKMCNRIPFIVAFIKISF